MKIKHNLVGEKFNQLTVIKLDIDKTEEKQRSYWICNCDCGNIKSVRGDSLIDGSVKSCGCLKREQDKINLGTSTHMLHGTRPYNIWIRMKDRCYNTNAEKYKVYGGRGIIVCDEWRNDFINFYNWAINNGYSDKLSIDRIDVNGNYEPSNCRWATSIEQGRNKQNTLYYTIKGVTKPFREWCEIYKVNYKVAHNRLKKYGEKDTDKIFYQGNLNQKTINKQTKKENKKNEQ